MKSRQQGELKFMQDLVERCKRTLKKYPIGMTSILAVDWVHMPEKQVDRLIPDGREYDLLQYPVQLDELQEFMGEDRESQRVLLYIVWNGDACVPYFPGLTGIFKLGVSDGTFMEIVA